MRRQILGSVFAVAAFAFASMPASAGWCDCDDDSYGYYGGTGMYGFYGGTRVYSYYGAPAYGYYTQPSYGFYNGPVVRYYRPQVVDPYYYRPRVYAGTYGYVARPWRARAWRRW